MNSGAFHGNQAFYRPNGASFLFCQKKKNGSISNHKSSLHPLSLTALPAAHVTAPHRLSLCLFFCTQWQEVVQISAEHLKKKKIEPERKVGRIVTAGGAGDSMTDFTQSCS